MQIENLDEAIHITNRGSELVSWRDYLTICKRYDIYPILFLKYLRIVFNYKNITNNIIYIGDEHGNLESLEFLENIYLPEVSKIQIINSKMKTLKGLSNIQVPNLLSIHIDNYSIDLSELTELNSGSLESIHIRNNLDTKIPPLNFPKLTYLYLNGFMCNIDIENINSSSIPSLSHLTVNNPRIGSKRLSRLNEINWHKLPNVKYIGFDYGNPTKLGNLDNTIQLDTSIPRSVVCLDFRKVSVSLSDDAIRLPNLETLYIHIECIGIIEKIDLPKLTKLGIYSNLFRPILDPNIIELLQSRNIDYFFPSLIY